MAERRTDNERHLRYTVLSTLVYGHTLGVNSRNYMCLDEIYVLEGGHTYMQKRELKRQEAILSTIKLSEPKQWYYLYNFINRPKNNHD